MITVNHALDILSLKLGLPALHFTDDQIGIDLTSDLTIFLSRLDDTTIEASCLLDLLGHPDGAMMRAMLEANFLGGAVGPGRLALDTDTADVILCECWNLHELDADSFEARFQLFADAAAFWLIDGTQGLMEQAEIYRADRLAASGGLSGGAPSAAGADDAGSVVMRL